MGILKDYPLGTVSKDVFGDEFPVLCSLFRSELVLLMNSSTNESLGIKQ